MTQPVSQNSAKENRIPIIEKAENDIITTTDGRKLIDLVSGFGTTLLGHARPEIVEALRNQAGKVWSTARVETDILLQAKATANDFSPNSHRLAGFYSTGMEAAEFALRVASKTTDRKNFVGFQRNMHGKSLATAYLCWPNPHADLPTFTHLPFLPDCSEDEILSRLNSILRKEETAALMIEPFQGSGGGYAASKKFFQEACGLARKYGTLIVADEVLCGFYRTGFVFNHPTKSIDPDVVLSGKTMGNGFPVSAVYCHQQIQITPQMLPGSTYSENPLAAAVVKATLSLMESMDLPSMTKEIEKTIQTVFADIEEDGFQLRGQGAFAVIEAPSGFDMSSVHSKLIEKGILVSCLGKFIRLLPAATILKENLLSSCHGIRETIRS